VIRRVSGPPVHLIGAAIARILIGAGAVHFYLSNYSQRAFVLGPHSYLTRTRAPTLYSLAHSTASFEVLFHLGLVAAIAFTVFGGRPLAAVHAVMFWSAYARNPDIFDGGDTFGRIAAILLIAAITNAYFAPGASRRREPLTPNSWSSYAHNGAVVVLGFQVLVVYQSAGLQKATGAPWVAGSALYQISQLRDYAFVQWTHVLTNRAVVVPLTNAIVVLEVGFPIAVWTRVRVPWVAACALMHAGIAVTMGLVGFALNMWGGLAVCLSDEDWAAVAGLIRDGIRLPSRRRSRASPRRRRTREPATPAPLP
jgi:hypothetical protein